MMRTGWAGFATAMRFLTIVPVPMIGDGPADRDPGWVPASTTAFFPLVGLVLGLALAAVAAVLPEERLTSAALVLIVWTAATGGLHEDGWADCADAALPAVDSERRLAILADPRIGAHGLVAVGVLLMTRFAAIAEAPAWALVLPPVLGRVMMVYSLSWAAPLRHEGLGASMAAGARPGPATLTTAVVLGCVIALLDGSGPVLLSAVGCATVVAAASARGVGSFLHSRLGGLSGDGHGAVGIAAETGALCALALWPGLEL